MEVDSMFVVAVVSILSILVLRYILKCLLPRPLVKDFKNKFVLITGCDSGFGKMSAIRLDQMGFRVIGACLTEQGKENLESVCSERLVGVVMDVTNSKQIQHVFEKVSKLVAEKGLWAVVNNAGFMSIAPIEWYSMDDFRKMADVNLWGLVEVTKTFLPLVKKAQGRIVNFASVAGILAFGNMGPYCITKYGVEAFSDCLRREMKRFNVKVCILEPSAFATPLLKEMFEGKLQRLYDGATEEVRQEYGEEYLNDFLRDKYQKLFNQGVSRDLHLVIDAVIDSIAARDPAIRYRVGGKMILFVIRILSNLPDFIQDMRFDVKFSKKISF